MPAKTSKRTNHGYRTDLLVKQSDPWAALDAIMATDPEPMGPEWFTVNDVMQRYGLGRVAAYNRCRALVNNGKADEWSGVTKANNRITSKYRLKGGTA